jgi:hypothetical protein
VQTALGAQSRECGKGAGVCGVRERIDARAISKKYDD